MFIPPRAGDFAEFNSRTCEVLSYEDDLVLMRPVDGDEDIQLSTAECETAQKAGTFLLSGENAYLGVGAATAFCLLTREEREEALERRDLMREIEDSSHDGEIPNKEVRRIAGAWAARLKRKRVPNHSTVRRWQRSWKGTGKDIFSLVPNYRARGNRNSGFPHQVEWILSAVINDHYLTLQRYKINRAYAFLVDAIRIANEELPPELRLPCPSLKCFKRRIAELDPYQVDLRRLGRQEADRLHKPAKRFTRTALYPNHIWQADATPLDVLIVDPDDGHVIGRLYLTVVIDQYSRSIVGYFLSHDKPSYISIAKAILHAVSPKDDLEERFPEIRGKWLCYGLPSILIVDNGMENHAVAFSAMCGALKIDLAYSARKYPQGKPHVERVIRTINEFFHGLAGTTFSNPRHRANYKSEEMASLTFGDAETQLLKFILDIYHVRKHRSLGRSPEEVWKEGVEAWRPRMPPHYLDLKFCYMIEETRTLQKDGIHFNNRIYYSNRLGEIWSRNRVDKSISFRHDPDSRKTILVIDTEKKEVIEVPCRDMPEYAEKVSEKEDKALRRMVAACTGNLTDEQKVALAYRESREMEEDSIKSTKAKRRKAKREEKAAKKAAKRSAKEPTARQDTPIPAVPPTPVPQPRFENDDGWGGSTDLLRIKRTYGSVQ